MLILETERLKIIPLTLPCLRKLLNGTPELEAELHLSASGMELDEHTHGAMLYLYDLAKKTPDSFPWITNWQIIDKKQNISIGSACFMNVPDEKGEIEIGYGIYPAFRGHGFMTEALEAICHRVAEMPKVTSIMAQTEPENIASQRVLEKCSFQPVNEHLFMRKITQSDSGID